MFLFLAPMLILPLGAGIAAGVARSVRAGVAAAVWAGLVTALTAFGVHVVTALNRVNIDASIRDDFEGVPPYDLELWFSSVVGQQLGAAITGLVMFPLWALLLGLIGAKSGKATVSAYREGATGS